MYPIANATEHVPTYAEMTKNTSLNSWRVSK